MRRILAVLAAILVFSAFAVAQPAETPDGEEDGPPGFVTDLVFNKVPGFLSGLFASLPVPDFVKGFFGAGEDSTNNQSN